MEIKDAVFVSSRVKLEELPGNNLPELAFIGRSNVGKSSLINMLTSSKDLAKTSQTPGKTQTINHFLIDNTWHLVDLPGYGFAKVSRTLREKWMHMIRQYLKSRECLFCVFVLVDSRLSPQKIDLEFINWLGENNIPLSIIFTKADKLKAQESEKNINAFKEALLQYWEALPEIFVSSAQNKLGKTEILNYFAKVLNS